jgi:serine/threonine-protein kinase
VTDLFDRLQQALGDAFRVQRELPLGGLGRLFLATDREGRDVVVQVMPPDVAQRVDAARFHSAIERAARLRHPAILAPVEAGVHEGLLYCVVPHPPGESLRQRLARGGALREAEVVQVLHDVADGLVYAHAHGVSHGALSADTIQVVEGRAVLTDFGVAQAVRAAETGTEPVLDARGDVRALAAVGHEMLAGSPAVLSPLPAGVTAALQAAVTRALADQGDGFATAAEFREAVGAPPSVMRRRGIRRRAFAIVAAVALVVAFVVQQLRARAGLDPDLLVVAPFEVLDTEHALWREGLVDVVAANLDGAGPLRVVSPSVAVRQWSGRADARSAEALGRRTRARLALFGRVVRAGGDSMRLSATLLDVATRGYVAEVELAAAEPRLDLLADSLSVALLRELGRSRPIGATRHGALGSSSPPALRAFLQGEQHYRRAEWDSALASYQRAIELDSGFALALYRAGIVLGWQSVSGDELSQEYLVRAASHNRGLPARDSMLVVAESLGAAVDQGVADNPRYWDAYRRLYATTAEATSRYPDDPETWYEFGEVRYHYPFFSSLQEMQRAFDRAIALDSSFAPAYIHPIELALRLGDRAAALRYLDRYLRLPSRDIYADGLRLTRELLARPGAPEVRQVLDTASAELLVATLAQFRGWADTAETGVRVARLLHQGRRTAVPLYADTTFRLLQLGALLAYHGHLREAGALAGRPVGWLYAMLATLGGVDPDSARARFARSLRSEPLWPRALAPLAAPWWAEQRDSTALKELARRADSLARAGAGALERGYARYLASAGRAFLALARGDTAEAARGLLALPDTACERCALYRVARAQILEAAELDSAAWEILSADPPGFLLPTDALWMLLRARVAERLGDREAAIRAYRFVVDTWGRGDPAVQPHVQESRVALRRLRP